MEEEKKRAEAERKAEEAARKAREEEEKRLAAERKRLEEEKKRAEAEARRQAEARRRAEELKRLAENLQREARTREIRAHEVTVMTAEYGQRIKAHVQSHWFLPNRPRRGMECLLSITLDETGVVTSVRILRSSGDRGFDRSAVAAVRRASPLPVPSAPDVMAQFRAFNFRFCPSCGA